MLARTFVVGFPLLPAALFLAVTGLHRSGLGRPGYATSPLIGVEFLLLLFTAAALAIQLPVLVYLGRTLGWRWAAAGAGLWAAALACFGLGVRLDAATLIYMT